MDSPARRIFLKATSAAAALPVALDAAAQRTVNPAAASASASAAGRPGRPAYRFFTAPEAAFIEAAVERLIPPDELGPGALDAGVPTYLDLQLGGAWGAGERLYRAGPWVKGEATQGYQLPLTPAELFRTALRGIEADLQQSGQAPFARLDGNGQDTYLTLLQTTDRDLSGVPSPVFFESLLAMTIEGYFGDPAYGGNVDMAAWRMIGFPGAYGAYFDLVDQHGLAFTGAPISLAETGRGTVHLMPDIPAVAPAPVPPPGAHAGHGATPSGATR